MWPRVVRVFTNRTVVTIALAVAIVVVLAIWFWSSA